MSIEKRGVSSWRVQTQIRDSEGNLRWIRRTVKFPETMSQRQQQKNARIEEARLIEEASKLTFSACPTVLAFYPVFLKRHCADSSIVTIDHYNYVINNHILPTLGDLRLDELTVDVLNEWMDTMRSKDLSGRSLRSYYTVLNLFLDEAVANDHIEDNPLKKIKPPKAAPSEATSSLTEEQFRALIRALEFNQTTSHRCAVLLAVMCGMRVGEICGLRITDIDFEHSEITISRSAKYTQVSGHITSAPKTASARRTISAPPLVMEALTASRRELDYISESPNHNPQFNYIIHNQKGDMLSNHAISSWWRAFSSRIGLAGIRFHDLRHTHATLLIANGVDPITVSKRLGHASPTTTLQIYAHALRRRDNDSAQIIQSLTKQNPNNLPNQPTTPEK